MISAAPSMAFAPVTVHTASSTIRMEAVSPEPKLMGKAFGETLPGVTAPMGYFDPLNLSGELSAEEILMFREAELAHGRVAMIAGLGFLVQENFHPIFPDVGGPPARHRPPERERPGHRRHPALRHLADGDCTRAHRLDAAGGGHPGAPPGVHARRPRLRPARLH